jgi:mannitol-specific phosphotransferase system IIBC component
VCRRDKQDNCLKTKNNAVSLFGNGKHAGSSKISYIFIAQHIHTQYPQHSSICYAYYSVSQTQSNHRLLNQAKNQKQNKKKREKQNKEKEKKKRKETKHQSKNKKNKKKNNQSHNNNNVSGH